MSKRVIHRFYVMDFSKLKDGDLFESFCGKRFIACDPPTPEESAEIAAKTADDPNCKKCDAIHKRRALIGKPGQDK